MNYDTLLILVHLDHSGLGRLTTYVWCALSKYPQIHISAVVNTLFRRPKHIINTCTAVQQANKPIDVNNNIDKLKLFIKNENQKSLLKWWIMIPY